MADDNVVLIEFGAKIDKLVDATNQVYDRLQHLSNSADEIGSGFRHLGELIFAAFSIERITAFVENMANLGEQTEITAAKLGATNETVTLFSGIAKLTGTSIDGMALSIERMSLNVQRSTRDAFDPAAQGLKVLGLNAKDLIGLPVDQYFDKLREAVSRFNPSLNLTNAVMAVGGRGVAQLIPMLQMGGEAYEKFKAAILQAQNGLAAAIPGMADTHTKLELLSLSTQSLGARIFTVLKPAIDLVVTTMTNWIQKLDSKTIKEFSQTLIDVLGNAVISMIGLFYEFGGVIDTLLSKMKLLLTGAAIGGAVGLLGGPGGVLIGALGGAGVAAAFGSWMEQFDSQSDKAKTDIDKQKEELVARVKSMMKAIADAISGGGGEHGEGGNGKTDAALINAGARNAIEAQRARYQADIALLQESLAQKKLLYDLDATLWKTTDDQKMASTMEATRQEFAAEQEKLRKIRDLWPAHSKEWEAEQLKMTQAVAKYSTEMVRLNAESIKSMATKFDDVFGQIQTSFNSSLRGLLSGTTTWAQTFKTILGDLVIYFIQAVEKMVFKWIAGQLAETVASQSAEGAKVAAATAGAAAALPEKIASFTSDIMASSARTFAGVFAFLAPFMGPAAAGPAAASQATVLAELANVPKFEFGTDFVPYTGLAIVHKGEKITPASENASPFSGNGAAGKKGGDTHNWYLIDGAGVQSFVQRNAGALAAAVVGHQTRNPSARPAW